MAVLKKINSFLSNWPIHVVLLPIYASLFLFAANIKFASYSPVVMIGPVAVYILCALIAWLIFFAFLRNIRRAGLVVTVPGVFIVFGGLFSTMIALWCGEPRIAGFLLQNELSLIFGILWLVLVVVLIKKVKSDLLARKLNYLVNVVFISLLLFIFTDIAVASATTKQFKVDLKQWPHKELAAEQQKKLPNIIVVILDGMPNQATMRYWFNDNSGQFENSLKELGFEIPKTTYMVYLSTFDNVSSLLNGEYFHKLFPGAQPQNDDNTGVKYTIRNNQAIKFLESYGYETYSMSPTNMILQVGAKHEISGNHRNMETAEFTSGMIGQSVCGFLSRFLYRLGLVSSYKNLYNYTLSILNFHDTFAKHTKASESPCFMFVHVLVGHGPYIFNSDGSMRDTGRGFTFNAIAHGDGKVTSEIIFNQVQFLSNEVNKSLKKILEKQAGAERPLAVFVMGDHGPHETPMITGDRRSKGKPFAAYYDSDGKIKNLDSLVMPNIFRHLLRNYWNVDIPILPAKAYDGTEAVEFSASIDEYFRQAQQKYEQSTTEALSDREKSSS